MARVLLRLLLLIVVSSLLWMRQRGRSCRRPMRFVFCNGTGRLCLLCIVLLSERVDFVFHVACDEFRCAFLIW